ncbi:class I SAM-dependent methyltransferase [Candidatus Pacearchaeota archaeon]|nr:class I SAM-dependent methyltransferase [Candidatus Pacearchaeota archaeon]
MAKKLDPQEGYARYAKDYDKGEENWDSFEKDYLRPYINESKGKKTLDAGAGTGRLSLKLLKAGADVTALDVSPEMLDLLKRKTGEIETVEGELEDMPFEDETFDMIFSSLAMVHLKKITPFLDECYRVLKDDGKLVLVNVHYRKPMILRDSQGSYSIKCYNHFPRHVREAAEELAYSVEEDILVTEGDDVWISQVLVLTK